jgi:hypothetical protein
MIIDLAFSLPLGTVFHDQKGRPMVALACPLKPFDR